MGRGRGQLWPFVAVHSGAVSTGEEIRRTRELRKLSRRNLAAAVGTSPKTIMRIENGRGGTGAAITLVREYLGLSEPTAASPGPGRDITDLSDALLWTEIHRMLAEAQRRYYRAADTPGPSPTGKHPGLGQLGTPPPDAWEQDEPDERAQPDNK